MDPELLKYLADMTPEQLMEAIRTGQLAGTSGIQPAPGTPAGAGSPWTPGVGLKVTEGQPIPMAAIREAAQFGDAATAVRPTPQALPGPVPAPGSPQFAAAQTIAPASEAALLQNQPVMGAGPKIPPGMPSGVNFVRPEGLVRADGPPMRAPLPRAGAQPIPMPPAGAGLPGSDPGLSAVKPKPFGLEDLLKADRPGAPPIAAAGAPVRPAVPAPATPASMPPLPGMSGISQVEGAFGAGPSAQADAWRQYLAAKGGQPGLAGAASGAGMGAPVPPPAAAPLPGAGAGMSPPPPPSAGASPGAGIPGGQRLSQADEAMLRMRAAAAESAQFAAKEASPAARAVRPLLKAGGGLLKAAAPLSTGYLGYKVLEGAADAYDPNAGMLDNTGNMIGGAARAAWDLRPTPMNMLFGGGTADMNDPNFKMGGVVGAGMAIKDYLDQRGQPAPFTEAQPGTSAAIRAAMSGGQSRPQDFDMDADGSPPGQSMAQEKAEYSPAPVRPKTNGAARPGGSAARPGSGKGTGAPAIPPSPETGVSGGSSGPGTSPYKLLGESLSVPLLDKMAVRPGGAPSPTPTGSWRDKGYTAMLNDKRGVAGEGRRLPLGAGPGEGARYGLDAEMKENLANSGGGPGLAFRPETGKVTLPMLDMQGKGELDETEEEKQARLAAARATISKHFAGMAPMLR